MSSAVPRPRNQKLDRNGLISDGDVLAEEAALLCQATIVCDPLGTPASVNLPSGAALTPQRFGPMTMVADILGCRWQFTNTMPGFWKTTVRV